VKKRRPSFECAEVSVVHFPAFGKWICQLAEVTGNQRSGFIALWLHGTYVSRGGAGFAAKLAALNGSSWRSASILKVNFQSLCQLTTHHFHRKPSPPEKPLRASLFTAGRITVLRELLIFVVIKSFASGTLITPHLQPGMPLRYG
jgi:hypothetical protein